MTTYTDAAGDAFRSLGDFATGLVTPTVKLGVTGLARSGKTVFITALVHNLIAGGRLPFFDAAAQGRVLRVYLEPQPDEIVPRFGYEKHLADLTADPPRWPESTRRVSQLRLTLEYASTKFWKRQLGRERLHIDIVDYPGEWLLDLPLLAMDYREWSRSALEQSRSSRRSKAGQAVARLPCSGRPDRSGRRGSRRNAVRYVQGVSARSPRRSACAVDAVAGPVPDAGRPRRLPCPDLCAARCQGRRQISRAVRCGR